MKRLFIQALLILHLLCLSLLTVTPAQAGSLIDWLETFTEKKVYPSTVEELTPMAQSGDAGAQYYLGRMYY